MKRQPTVDQIAEIIRAASSSTADEACRLADQIFPRATGTPWTRKMLRDFLARQRRRQALQSVQLPWDAIEAWDALRRACLAALTDLAANRPKRFHPSHVATIAAILTVERLVVGQPISEALEGEIIEALRRIAPLRPRAPVTARLESIGNGRPSNRAKPRPRDSKY